MASDGSDQEQRGTVAEYQKEFEILISRVMGKSDSLLASIYIFGLKSALIRALLWSNPTTLGEAFALARVAEAHVQDLEEMIRHKPNKVEAVKTSMVVTFEEHEHQENQDNLNEIFEEKDDAIPPISADAFGSNGGNDSRSSRSRTPAKEVVDNGNGYALIFLVGYDTGSEVVTGLLRKFQEGDMVDALSRVEQKTSKN
ncbi:hypothetical protein Tco_1087226 [Tanacetum coccineum]